jgi:hypothetical protein
MGQHFARHFRLPSLRGIGKLLIQVGEKHHCR